MATRKSQRIMIIVIAIVMIVGTIGSFAVMVLSTQNDQIDSKAQQEAQAKIQEIQFEYQAQVDAQASELSKTYYPKFKEYADRPAKFDIDSVKSLKTTDLSVGDGPEITDETKFAAYYIGWNPDGVVFDQSIDGDSLKSPFTIDGLAETGVIEGWKQGLKGMKIGGVRLLEIPSDLAYGESGQGESIPPNTPLKFVVMAIERPEEIPFPDIDDKLIEEAYGGQL